jgi:predicted homoserine dehydrogenase-like protein
MREGQSGARRLAGGTLVAQTPISEDWRALVSSPQVDIVIEATGNPMAAVEHVLEAFRHGKHVVMVTVEADAFCGPLLAKQGRGGGSGLQPGLRRPAGAHLRSRGLGARGGLSRGRRGPRPQVAAALRAVDAGDGVGALRPHARAGELGGLNPKMFNSFLDGSKPAIETSAVCNATGLTPAPGGLAYPAGSIDQIPGLMRPRDEGGVLHHKGQVEVVSSLRPDGTPIDYDIRFGVFVAFEGESEYIRRCFAEYGVKTDASGRYACLYKRWHLIGLEVGISVASVGLRGEPTGCATGFRADAVATAKRALKAGEILDGEGGYTVVGRLMPAADSLAQGCLPLGLAHGWKVLKPVSAGQPLRWSDVAVDAEATAVRARREMEALFRAPERHAA